MAKNKWYHPHPYNEKYQVLKIQVHPWFSLSYITIFHTTPSHLEIKIISTTTHEKGNIPILDDEPGIQKIRTILLQKEFNLGIKNDRRAELAGRSPCRRFGGAIQQVLRPEKCVVVP